MASEFSACIRTACWPVLRASDIDAMRRATAYLHTRRQQVEATGEVRIS